MFIKGDESGGGFVLPALGVLATAVGMGWLTVFMITEVDGDLLTPIPDGGWSGAPVLLLVVTFGAIALAASAVIVTVVVMLVIDAVKRE